MVTAVVIVATLYAVYQILLHYEVFETVKGGGKVIDDFRKQQIENKKREREIKKLGLYDSVVQMFHGLVMGMYTKEEHEYIIKRLNIRSEILGRYYTAEELRGKYVLYLLIGLMLIPVGVVYKVAWVGTLVGIGVFVGYKNYYLGKIADEDKIIEANFLNLYLLLYSRLRAGSKARLSGVVQSYIKTMELHGDMYVREVMLKLAQTLLGYLLQYEDHVAVPKLRETYKSGLMVNFCNVASQALQGIDNSDNLLTFKQALIRIRSKEMARRREKAELKSKRAIMLIYAIVVCYMLISYAAKMPQGLM